MEHVKDVTFSFIVSPTNMPLSHKDSCDISCSSQTSTNHQKMPSVVYTENRKAWEMAAIRQIYDGEEEGICPATRMNFMLLISVLCCSYFSPKRLAHMTAVQQSSRGCLYVTCGGHLDTCNFIPCLSCTL